MGSFDQADAYWVTDGGRVEPRRLAQLRTDPAARHRYATDGCAPTAKPPTRWTPPTSSSPPLAAQITAFEQIVDRMRRRLSALPAVTNSQLRNCTTPWHASYIRRCPVRPSRPDRASAW
jgi:hypothetical protein